MACGCGSPSVNRTMQSVGVSSSVGTVQQDRSVVQVGPVSTVPATEKMTTLQVLQWLLVILAVLHIAKKGN